MRSLMGAAIATHTIADSAPNWGQGVAATVGSRALNFGIQDQ